jgi:hypothetical protein
MCIYVFNEKPQERANLGKLNADGMTILKYILEKKVWRCEWAATRSGDNTVMSAMEALFH